MLHAISVTIKGTVRILVVLMSSPCFHKQGYLLQARFEFSVAVKIQVEVINTYGAEQISLHDFS
jgi:hypothetical protein